jgi:hypothetical protein
MSIEITDEQMAQAVEAYREFVGQTGPRYKHTSANLLAVGTIVERILGTGGVVTVEHFMKGWLEASNQGLLEEPLSPEQEKALEAERIKERNARLEAKDRRGGGTFVDPQGRVYNSHLSEAEKEDLLEKSSKESAKEYKKAIAWIRGEADRRKQPQELAPSATDAAYQLNNILAPVTISTATKETKQAITKWMRTTDSKLLLMARRNNPELAAKADKILLKTFEADI